jgi:ubiquinone/menaquinone biosynthesis C-methylase UbiE
MPPVDYDNVAPSYDRRYERNRYDGVCATIQDFVGGVSSTHILEVGCGTGHWLAELSNRGFRGILGLDVSAGMLRRARVAAPDARLIRAGAHQLPFADACLSRVFCVNALHHFADPQAFMRECHRVLQPDGGVLTIGLDPHAGGDRWWVYDFFPAALAADQRRYLSTVTIRDWLAATGFTKPATSVAEHIAGETPFDKAEAQGFFDRHATSQLMVIEDADYERGIDRLLAERPPLLSDVRLYATTAWR